MLTLKEIRKNIKDNGGITMDNHRNKISFNRGYIVSTQADNFNTKNLRKITAKVLKQYCEKAEKVNAVIGIYTRQDGSYDLDINARFMDKQKALEFGKANKQEAIFDSAKNDIILC